MKWLEGILAALILSFAAFSGEGGGVRSSWHGHTYAQLQQIGKPCVYHCATDEHEVTKAAVAATTQVTEMHTWHQPLRRMSIPLPALDLRPAWIMPQGPYWV